MSEITVNGSCHCGAVRFRCLLDPRQPTSRCNCSICRKSRFWKAIVPANAFTLLQGSDDLREYRFGSRTIAHRFCRHCGVKVFGRVDAQEPSDAFYAVNLACIDDLNDEAKAGLAVDYQDGSHDRWEAQPRPESIASL